MTSVLVPVELRGLVVLARPALDLLFLGEETLELGVGFLHERRGLFGHLAARALHGPRRGLVGTAATTTRAHHAPLRRTRRLADGHRGLARDLVLGGRLVGEDLTLVDPLLHADACERGAGLGLAVVDIGPQRV